MRGVSLSHWNLEVERSASRSRMSRSCDFGVHLASILDASWRHYSRQQGNDVPFASFWWRYGYGIPVPTHSPGRDSGLKLRYQLSSWPLCMLVGKLGRCSCRLISHFSATLALNRTAKLPAIRLSFFNQPTSHSPQALLLTATQQSPPTSFRLHFHVFALKECSTSFLVGVVQLQLTKPLLVLKRLNLS